MEVRHDDDELARIESDPNYRGKLDVQRVRGFRKVLNLIRSVENETELYQWGAGTLRSSSHHEATNGHFARTNSGG